MVSPLDAPDRPGSSSPSGETATEPAHSPLERLLELQELDLELDRLAHRRAHLPARAELAKLRDQLGRLDSERATVDKRRSGFASRQTELERSIEESTERIHSIEKRLYHSDTAYAFRDQQAMAEEVKALEKRRSDLEDEEIEVMEELEPIDNEMAAIEARRTDLIAAGAKQMELLGHGEREIDAEVAQQAALRAPLVADVPEKLENEYERLREKFGGVGVARLIKGSCSGCHLVLPATELDRIRRAGGEALFHCDQCGRLLVP
jgi:predicted  nucleic acid-binding Zn-ribbon protein